MNCMHLGHGQVAAGGGISYFRAQVDKLTMLVTRQQLQNPYYAGNTSINHLVSMVAFRYCALLSLVGCVLLCSYR